MFYDNRLVCLEISVFLIQVKKRYLYDHQQRRYRVIFVAKELNHQPL